MSSLNFKGFAHLAVVAGLAFGLSGCFRPLHGPTASGESLQTVLASIDVPDLQWSDAYAHFAHTLRSELIFALNGSGSATPKRYVLLLSYNQGLSTPLVDAVAGRALAATVTGNLTYTLREKGGSTVLATGTATSQVSYERVEQRFATVRAARDAEIRLAKDLAEQVKTRLSAVLAVRR